MVTMDNDENKTVAHGFGMLLGKINKINSDIKQGAEMAEGAFFTLGVKIADNGKLVEFKNVQKTYKPNQWGYKIFGSLAKGRGEVKYQAINIKTPQEATKIIYEVNKFWKKNTGHRIIIKNGLLLEIGPTYSVKK